MQWSHFPSRLTKTRFATCCARGRFQCNKTKLKLQEEFTEKLEQLKEFVSPYRQKIQAAAKKKPAAVAVNEGTPKEGGGEAAE